MWLSQAATYQLCPTSLVLAILKEIQVMEGVQNSLAEEDQGLQTRGLPGDPTGAVRV